MAYWYLSSQEPTIGTNFQDVCHFLVDRDASPWLEGNVMKLLLFRHHVLPCVTSMLSDFTPYAYDRCFILYPCLSLDFISIVIVDIICLLIPYPELYRIYAYWSITHLWLHHPQLRSTTAHYAPLMLLVSLSIAPLHPTPHLIIQSDGTISPYLV